MKKFLKDESGQALVEFALVLFFILLPLVFWMLRFSELIEEKHKLIESVRFATWERAYGRRETDVKNQIKQIMRDASLYTRRSDVTVKFNFTEGSTHNSLKVPSLGFHLNEVTHNIPEVMELNQETHFSTEIIVEDKLPFNYNVELRDTYGLVSDSWNLTDYNMDNAIDNEDLREHVNKIIFWPGPSRTIKKILDFSNRLSKSYYVQKLVKWAGQELDVEPRGYQKLECIPEQSKK